MTTHDEHDDPAIDRDALAASSVIDGFGSAEDLRLAERDPHVADLVERFEMSRELVSRPVSPLTDEVREHQLVIALAQLADAGPVDGDAARVVDTNPTPITRSRRVSPARILAVAAVLLVAVMVPVMARVTDHNEDRSDVAMVNSQAVPGAENEIATPDAAGPASTTSTTEALAGSASRSASSGSDAARESATGTGHMEIIDGDLGSVESPQELRNKLSVALSTGAAGSDQAPDPTTGAGAGQDSAGQTSAPASGVSGADDPQRCEQTAGSSLSDGAVLVARMALSWRSVSAVAFAYTTGSTTTVVVTSTEGTTGCAVMLTLTL